MEDSSNNLPNKNSIAAGVGAVTASLKKRSNIVSMASASAGAGIDMVSATRDERGFFSDIADEYRPEIAERLGVAEDQVTQEHYQQCYQDNPVLKQVKDVAKMSDTVRVASSAISTGAGVLAGLAASSATRPKQQPTGKRSGKDPSNIAGGVAATVSAVVTGKLVRKVLHTSRIEDAMENTAHNKIMHIKEKQQRGEETTAVDVFGVQLALNPQAQQAIKENAGQNFEKMSPEQQAEVLEKDFPELNAANKVMAQRINEDGIRPQQLLFGHVPAARRNKAHNEPEEKADKPDRPSKSNDGEMPFTAPGHPDLGPAALITPPRVESSNAQAASEALLERQKDEAVTAPETTIHGPTMEDGRMHRDEPERNDAPKEASGFAAKEQSPENYTQRTKRSEEPTLQR
ncbi:MAG: hypothetical protein MK052_05620 [Alphaproteobacteria bacterium]|nr:hypothetical protein [Alphaproteobacteria bacterium]